MVQGVASPGSNDQLSKISGSKIEGQGGAGRGGAKVS